MYFKFLLYLDFRRSCWYLNKHARRTHLSVIKVQLRYISPGRRTHYSKRKILERVITVNDSEEPVFLKNCFPRRLYKFPSTTALASLTMNIFF